MTSTSLEAPPREHLAALRSSIDAIDDRLLELLADRSEVVAAIADAKARTGQRTLDPERERAVLDRVSQKGAGRFGQNAVTAIFREIMSASVAQQRPLTVARLGPSGTWTELAARTLFGSAPRYLDEATVDAVVDSVAPRDADYGVVPIESSIEGAVTSTLDALITSECRIRREIVVPVTHSIGSRAGSLAAIERVVSHPQALAQCRAWLRAHVPDAVLVPAGSTAAAAHAVADDPRAAAIAAAHALYAAGLTVLRSGIEDRPAATRFVAVAEEDAPRTGDDRTTIAFRMADDGSCGALRRALSVLEEAGVNMTRIESRPAREEAWRYVFVADLRGHRADAPLARALDELARRSDWLRLLGSYPRDPRSPR